MSVFYLEKRFVLSLKSQCFATKRGNFQTGEQGWVLLFPVSEGAGITESRYYDTMV